MRVLWFTGVQFPALSSQGLTRGGWQEGLRLALEQFQPQVELVVVNFGSGARGPLVQGNATYVTLPRRTPPGRLARYANNWRHVHYSPEEVEQAVEAVKRFRPDLVHFHGTENFFGLIAGRIDPPAVLSIQAIIHGLQPLLFTDAGGRDLLRQLVSLRFLKGEGLIHRWLTLKKYLPVEQEILGGCRNFIGRTGWDRAMLAALNPQAQYFHCDEVLADEYYAAEWHPSDGRPVLYTTTTDAFFKGSLTLARAAAVLKRRGWKDVQVRLAGAEANSYVGNAMARLVRAEGLEGSLTWLGRLDPARIVREMQGAGIYVHASHMDNSPNSLCEAMLAGMPCVAAGAGGVPSLVDDGTDGLLYPDRDVYLLAEKIQRLFADPELAARLGAAARRRARARHDRGRIAARTVEIYTGIVRGASATAPA